MTHFVDRFVEQATIAATKNGKSLDGWKREFAQMLTHLIVTECATVVDSLIEESYGVATRWATGDDLIKHFEGEAK